MGNLCSKSANEDNFSQPGRVLGSGPTNSGRSSVPVPSKTASSSTPGRTLGGTAAASQASTAGDPRSAAALAAEERAAKAKVTTGKLSGQLAAQKKQTQSQLLQENSNAERGARIADANTEARNWN